MSYIDEWLQEVAHARLDHHKRVPHGGQPVQRILESLPTVREAPIEIRETLAFDADDLLHADYGVIAPRLLEVRFLTFDTFP